MLSPSMRLGFSSKLPSTAVTGAQGCQPPAGSLICHPDKAQAKSCPCRGPVITPSDSLIAHFHWNPKTTFAAAQLCLLYTSTRIRNTGNEYNTLAYSF